MKFAMSLDEKLFHEKVMRDLVSIIRDPLIIESLGALSLQKEMCQAVERFLSGQGERLTRMIAPPDPRLPLGKWFERVFLLALRITYPFDQVFHSIVVNDGGELDFLVQHRGRLIHIECSVKYFLFHRGAGTGLSAFIGPGGQDRLDLKLKKMRDVQLHRAIPDWLGFELPVERVLWMGGRLHFLDESQEGWPIKSPDINAGCLKGFWSNLERLRGKVAPGNRLVKLPRQWWMTSLEGLSEGLLTVFDEVYRNRDSGDAMMVAEIDTQGGFAREIRRGFILPTEAHPSTDLR